MLGFGKDGGYRVLSKLSTAWAEQGHNVELILGHKSEMYYPLSEKVKITYLSGKSKYDNAKVIVPYIIKNFDKYDVLLANQNRTAFYIYFACLRRRDFSKAYYYIQAYEPDFYKTSRRYDLKTNMGKVYYKTLAWLSYFLPLTHIVNSPIYLNYKNIRADKVVYPGIDLNNYYSKDVTSFNSILKVGTIGRNEEWKGTADVCKAMEILNSKGVDFEFCLAFNDFDTLPHLFVKPDGDEKLAAFYRDMDIVVAVCKGQHGSIHYPIIEAMAVGSSVICTDYFPSSGSNAYKVDESAPEQIADAVKNIMNNKKDAIKKRRRALEDVQQFSWAVIANKFMSYLKEGDKTK